MDINDKYDQETVMVMEKVLSKNSNCIDIGAHAGTLLSQMQRISPKGIHYAFEPIPELFEDLQTRYPDAKIYRLALSDKNGKSTFKHVINNPAYSGLKLRRYDTKDPIIEDIMVDTKKLDDELIPKLKIGSLNLEF
ncbi:FkbM family methyltransferase [Methanosarcina sp.]|uniref:FkbM family methyltransferase n=1 Tax=Methanosarcina sp. TaxID=2213 RepID=UPI003C785022